MKKPAVSSGFPERIMGLEPTTYLLHGNATQNVTAPASKEPDGSRGSLGPSRHVMSRACESAGGTSLLSAIANPAASRNGRTTSKASTSQRPRPRRKPALARNSLAFKRFLPFAKAEVAVVSNVARPWRSRIAEAEQAVADRLLRAGRGRAAASADHLRRCAPHGSAVDRSTDGKQAERREKSHDVPAARGEPRQRQGVHQINRTRRSKRRV